MRAYYNEIDPQAAAWLRSLMERGLITDGVVDERSIADVRAEDLVGFDRVHFFAGIGGWEFALQLADWGNRPVWTGSCPCQPFSSAGNRKGTQDERHLWPEMYRLIRECKPAIVFGEQVESAVRHGWLDGVFADLEGEGYACGAAVLGAHSVGAPHIRQRLWWLADATGVRCEQRRSAATVAIQGECPERSRQHERSEQAGELAGRLEGLRRISGLADAEHALGRSEHEVDREAPRRHRLGWGGAVGGLGHAEQQLGDGGRDEQERGPEGRVADRRIGAGCDTGGLGDSPGGGLAIGGDAAQSEPVRYDVRSSWSGSQAILCRDGKARTIKSRLAPLVDGLPRGMVPSCDISESYAEATAEARVMRLKGYGNAIVPQVAATFIRAYIDSRE
jgi:DNA (cytosine-5)-methyltransferase 1